MIVIGLLSTGGYGFGYGNSKKEGVDYILNRIENEKLPCHVIKFVVYPYGDLGRVKAEGLELYAAALTGSTVAKQFCQFIGKPILGA